jgi:hypothetical protein
LSTLPWNVFLQYSLKYLRINFFMQVLFYFCSQFCSTWNFGSFLIGLWSIIHHSCKTFLGALPHFTSKFVFLFMFLNSTLNSRIAFLINIGYYPQRFSTLKCLFTDVSSLLYEHSKPVLEVETVFHQIWQKTNSLFVLPLVSDSKGSQYKQMLDSHFTNDVRQRCQHVYLYCELTAENWSLYSWKDTQIIKTISYKTCSLSKMCLCRNFH